MGHRSRRPRPAAPHSPQPGRQANHSVYSEAAELMRRIKESEGERVFWKMEALSATVFVFAENRLELANRLRQLESPENRAKVFGVRNREVLRLFQKDSMRLLHNFLASAFTLIEHTRILTRELYDGHPFNQEYQQKVAELFSDSALAGFVQGLRNWMLHRGLLPVVVRRSDTGTNGELVSSVLLNAEDLKTWDKWDARAREYLASTTSDLRLSDLVDSYSGLVHGFHSWLEKRMLEMHAVALQEVDELQSRLKALYGVTDMK